MKQLHLAIVAVTGWNGGVVYTQNLIKALAMLPASERPKMTLLMRHDDKRFELSYDKLDGHAFYPWWRSHTIPKLRQRP